MADLRKDVQELQSKLPDSVFGYDLTPIKQVVIDAYNVVNEQGNRITALEADNKALAARVTALETKLANK